MKKIITIVVMMSLGVFMLYTINTDPNWEERTWLKVVIIATTALFAFNMIVRNFSVFKPYFLSGFNFLSAKEVYTFEYELESGLMFEKIKEAIIKSPLKLRNANVAKKELFATTSLTMKSWGENIYVELISIPKGTQVKIYSVAISQVVVWGNNDKNISNLMTQFEKSLII